MKFAALVESFPKEPDLSPPHLRKALNEASPNALMGFGKPLKPRHQSPFTYTQTYQ